MDTAVSQGLTSLVATASPIVIATYLAIYGAMVTLALGTFGMKMGWGKLWKTIRGGH